MVHSTDLGLVLGVFYVVIPGAHVETIPYRLKNRFFKLNI
jgi:hypothetical protein